MVGGRDDGDAVDDPLRPEFGGEAQRERGLAGARGRGGEEVAGHLGEVLLDASACQARSLLAVPHAARSGKDGERCSAAEVPG